jgi:hypothetical protein
MDLFDSIYGRMIWESQYSQTKEQTLDELRQLHSNTIQNIQRGCFLDESATSKKILHTIRAILELIHRTCDEIERESGRTFIYSQINNVICH